MESAPSLRRRNRQVAEALQQRGLATLLMDLLTHDEEMVDIPSGHLRSEARRTCRRGEAFR
jgi:hypothetical protein